MSTPIDKAYFEQALFDQQEELLGVSKLARESSSTVELDQTRMGRLSRMDAIQMQEMSKATDVRRNDELRRVTAALARIDSGDYGYCVECGEDIPEARLKIDMAATHCVPCANAVSN
ncbi:MAG: TraR/DksA family transcriptional regulator [Woeseia sp.]|jgi:DnaK suppressor protein|nr:TraR/DksA family transcriptional regulator [Pseudomonadota bacterium]MBT6208838.1 TraR/DksA family transcriptional regulator [Woeseia sp.]